MRKHEWKPVVQYEGSPYVERLCSLCGLKDSFGYTDDSSRRKTWRITEPCIEPVPERVEFEVVITELAAHPVDVWLELGGTVKRTFETLVYCEGRPGAWEVGLDMTGRMFPREYHGNTLGKKTYKTIEEASAAFLRWMRARHYDPYKYSDLRYAEQLARPSSCCDDD